MEQIVIDVQSAPWWRRLAWALTGALCLALPLAAFATPDAGTPRRPSARSKGAPKSPAPPPRCQYDHPECPTGFVFCGYAASPSGALLAICEPENRG